MAETKRGPHGENCACPPGDYAGLGCPNPAAPLDLDITADADKYLVTNQDDWHIRSANPPCFVFQDDTKEIGRLEWRDGLMTFTGNADASAKLFFAAVCGYFNMEKPKENPNGKD